MPDRDLGYYLELACGPIRRYGRAEPIALNALLRMLRDVAVSARDDDQRREVDRQTALVAEETSDSLSEHDRRQVTDMADRVRLALRGDVRKAYQDQSGETRSV